MPETYGETDQYENLLIDRVGTDGRVARITRYRRSYFSNSGTRCTSWKQTTMYVPSS